MRNIILLFTLITLFGCSKDENPNRTEISNGILNIEDAIFEQRLKINGTITDSVVFEYRFLNNYCKKLKTYHRPLIINPAHYEWHGEIISNRYFKIYENNILLDEYSEIKIEGGKTVIINKNQTIR